MELAKIASLYLNGCTYCLDRCIMDAKTLELSQEYMLGAWGKSPKGSLIFKVAAKEQNHLPGVVTEVF